MPGPAAGTLERVRTDRLDLDGVLDLRVQPLVDQDLAPGRLGASRAARFVTEPIAA